MVTRFTPKSAEDPKVPDLDALAIRDSAKRSKYGVMAVDQGKVFLLFAMESFGGLAEEALKLGHGSSGGAFLGASARMTKPVS